MIISKYGYDKEIVILSMLIIIGSIFTRFLDFVNVILPQVYCVIFLSILGGVLVTLHFYIESREKYIVNQWYIVFILFLVYILFRSIFTLSNINLLRIYSFVLLFLIFNSIRPKFYFYLNYFFIVTGFGQAVYGLLQYIRVFQPTTSFPIVGSFDNPAGFSLCLAAIFPLCFTLPRRTSKISKYLYYAVLLVFPLLILLSESRTGIIAILLVAFIYIHVHRNRIYFIYRIIVWILILGVLIFLFSLLGFKVDSSLGRLYIWRITTNMLHDFILCGRGSDSFLSQYMVNQAAFLNENPQSDFAYLADNVFHPFNEYLLLIVEFGIVGGLFFLIMFVMLISHFRKFKLPYVLSVLSIIIFGLFSYPLKYPFSSVILTFCISQIIPLRGYVFRLSVKMKKIIVPIIISLCMVSCYLLYVDVKFEYQWNRISCINLYEQENIQVEKYDDLYENWNKNPLFLYNYSALLNYNEMYSKSLEVANYCLRYLNNYDLQILIADNYFKLYQMTLSEIHYMNALNMCPNRFIPLIQLMYIYDLTGRPNEALKIAERIISKPVKVRSLIVTNIKYEAAKRVGIIK